MNFYAKRFHIFDFKTFSIPLCRPLSVRNRILSCCTAHKKLRTQNTIHGYEKQSKQNLRCTTSQSMEKASFPGVYPLYPLNLLRLIFVLN